ASTELARRRDELAVRRAEQQRAADDLQAERRSVELALSSMANREQALQSRLIVRASRGERAPPDEPPAPGPTPAVPAFRCPRPSGGSLERWRVDPPSPPEPSRTNGVTCRSNVVWTASSSRATSRGWPTARSTRCRP